ncbi:hypothetical protein [Nonomuraea sp. GTA35]|uniref:hypothetical protein n=1 Tax=Nonomuraea sp. GTA35 TaxID=1676746 RepID=UPI0035C15CC7
MATVLIGNSWNRRPARGNHCCHDGKQDPDDHHYVGVKVVDADGGAVGLSVLRSGIEDKPGDVPRS